MTGGFDLRWVADSLADPPPEPGVLVDGLVRRGELVVVGAPRATGKSWLVLNLAALVGRGDGYLLGALQVKERTPVLLCHGETTAWMAAQRWRMLLGEDPPPLVAELFEPFHVGAAKVRHEFHAPDSSERWSEETTEGRLDARLRLTVSEHNFGLVVMDPWVTFYAGSENSNDETEAAVSMLRRLAAETEVAIVVVHHLGKAQEGRDPEDLWRGASRLADAASTRVTLLPRYSARDAEERGLSEEEARRHVRVRVLRREAPTPGFFAYLGHDGWWQRTEGDVERPLAGDRSRPISDDELALALGADGGRWASLAEAATSLRVSGRAARAAIARAIEAGLVVEARGKGGGARGFVLRETTEEDPS